MNFWKRLFGGDSERQASRMHGARRAQRQNTRWVLWSIVGLGGGIFLIPLCYWLLTWVRAHNGDITT